MWSEKLQIIQRWPGIQCSQLRWNVITTESKKVTYVVFAMRYIPLWHCLCDLILTTTLSIWICTFTCSPTNRRWKRNLTGWVASFKHLWDAGSQGFAGTAQPSITPLNQAFQRLCQLPASCKEVSQREAFQRFNEIVSKQVTTCHHSNIKLSKWINFNTFILSTMQK